MKRVNKMTNYKNKPQDLKISYKADTYEKIEELLELQEGEKTLFHFMLSLFGYLKKEKTPLETKDNKVKSHDFSLRTMYPKDESSFDAYFGLLTILDNLDMPYDRVIKDLAFERTEKNNTPFLKMTNVKTFYEYFLTGIGSFEDRILKKYGTLKKIDIADSIYEFLTEEDPEIQIAIEDILIDLKK
jgi:hypothetical protein